MPNGRLYVDPPVFTPLPFGLLTSLGDVIRTPADPHWQAGVTYETVCASGNTTYDDCIVVTGSGLGQPVAPSPTKVANTTIGRRGATPFTVFTEVDCSEPGFWSRAEEVVGDALTRNEQWQVERALWTGVAGGQVAVFPHLAASASVSDEDSIVLQTAATQVTGTAVLDVVEGIGLLEQQLANCYDGVPVLHVPRSLAPALALAMLLVREGPRYRTPGGSVIVFGGGYPGTGPDGSNPAPGSTWVYGTGGMFIYRGAPTVMRDRESIVRAQNTGRALAERTYALGWECCHIAVRVTLGGMVSGSPLSAT